MGRLVERRHGSSNWDATELNDSPLAGHVEASISRRSGVCESTMRPTRPLNHRATGSSRRTTREFMDATRSAGLRPGLQRLGVPPVRCVPGGRPAVEPPLPALSIETETVHTSIEPSLTDGFDRTAGRGRSSRCLRVRRPSTDLRRTSVATIQRPATAEAALATVDDDADPCATSAIWWSPGEAVVDLILAPVRMVRTPPWRTVYGPQNDPGLLPGAPRGPRPTTEDRP